MQDNLIDSVLKENLDTGADLSISMRDGTLITGKVSRFDGYVVVLAGEPETVVYRHSILKLSGAGATKAEKRGPRREERDMPKGSEKKPGAKQPGARPARQPGKKPAKRRDERSPARVTETQELENPLAEQMKKWLDNQKGDK